MSSTKKERFFHVTELLFQQILAVFVLLILWELFKSQFYDINTKRTWHVILCVVGFTKAMATLIAPSKESVLRVTEILFQQILALFFILIIWELFKSDAHPASCKETWHVIFNVLGVALCMAEGVQIYRKQSIVTIGNTRDEKRIAHLAVMAFAFLCITIGISLKISEKTQHFKTIHSQLGLSCWVISFVALIGGITAYYSRSLPRVSPRIVKILHIFIGLTAYILAVATLIYGLEYLMGAHSRGWVALTVLLLIYVTYSLLEPCISFYNYAMDR